MTTFGEKRFAIALSVVVAILAVLAAWGWTRATMNEIHAKLADGWSEILQEGRDAALKSTNVIEVADKLRWVGRFYRPERSPSGIERHHYNLMERVRVGYQRDIVAHLRQLTGDQLGDDPKLWAEKYAKPER